MKFLLVIAFAFLACGGGVDPNSLQSCGDHCRYLPGVSVPDAIQSKLEETSPGIYCVPDRYVALGGYWAAPCTAILKLEGRCLGTCIPAVGKDPNVVFLSKDVCDPGEVCVPCLNPFTKAETGACRIAGDYPRR